MHRPRALLVSAPRIARSRRSEESSWARSSLIAERRPPTDTPPPPPATPYQRLKRFVFGAPRDVEDPHTYHSMSLIALLAWVGLGADGLSSSSYGPDEAFRALGDHRALAIFLALATGVTVLIISVAYSQIIKHFPFGGGGYVVASQLLGPRAGVVSGSALLVDYILTISVSVASGADAIFSFLPPAWHAWKLSAAVLAILLLVVLNLRGVKESVAILAPIFGLFLLTHLILIVGGIGSHLGEVPKVASEVGEGLRASHGSSACSGCWPSSSRPTRWAAAPTPASRRSPTASRSCASPR